MFGFGRKKNQELEDILLSLNANASNNYKDAAQSNYRELLEKFEELKNTGRLKEKQAAYYAKILEEWEPQMKNYTHFDQKPDIQGLSELKN